MMIFHRVDLPNEGIHVTERRKLHIAAALGRIGMRGMRVLDLGAGHGIFSKMCLDMGAVEVTAVDARPERITKTRHDERLKIEIADVMDFDVNGYDVILNLGLLYHLDLSDQEALLKRCSYTTNLVCTHFVFSSAFHISDIEHYPLVSDNPHGLTIRNGYYGMYYREAASEEGLRGSQLSSHKNLLSFWHTEESLYRLFTRSGFETVVKTVPNYYPNRTQYTLFPT